MFLTNRAFRKHYGNAGPVLVWLNLNSKQEVDDLYEAWSRCQARIVSRPESKPWKLHEFTVADLDGNRFRVFYAVKGEEVILLAFGEKVGNRLFIEGREVEQ